MTTNNKLATIIAELDTVLSQMRALQDEYMPLKYKSIELQEEKEKLEEQLLSEDQVEDDKRFDELIESITAPTEEEVFNAQLEENSRFSRILEKGDDGRSLHEIKMQQIKDLESSQ